tara:strand:- start:66 stop:1061 length:996 start_codon:yes stop_codon:yes gene_type:complete
VQDVDLSTLIQLFGKEQAQGLHRKCHGIYNDAVVASWKPKSCLAMKSFWPPLTTNEQFNMWLRLLTTELVERIGDDNKLCSRLPKTLVLHLRGATNKDTKFTRSEYANTNHQVKRIDSSVRQPMPRHCEKNCENVDAIMAAVHSMCSKLPQGTALPLTRLGISAENFMDCVPEKQRISSFFAASNTTTSAFSDKDFLKPPEKKKKKTTASFFNVVGPSGSGGNGTTTMSSSSSPTSSSTTTTPKNPNTISFSSSTTATTAPTFRCDKCGGKEIPIANVAEHADYHVALELSKTGGAMQRMKARSSNFQGKQKKKKTAKNSFNALFGVKQKR